MHSVEILRNNDAWCLQLKIIAEDGGIPDELDAICMVTVFVEDVNDNLPVFEDVSPLHVSINPYSTGTKLKVYAQFLARDLHRARLASFYESRCGVVSISKVFRAYRSPATSQDAAFGPFRAKRSIL